MSDFIDQIWRSSANQQVSDANRDQALGLAAGFARRDARRRLRLWITGGILTLFTLAMGAALFDRAARGAPAAALAILALSWAMWGLLAAQARPNLVARRETLPMAETLAAMLKRNRRERRSIAQMAAIVLLTIAPLWMAVNQLEAAGQASQREALQMGGLLTLALVGGAAFLLIRLFGALAPERRRLERLIADHMDPGSLKEV
ncbi:MAG: hypothetical protein JWM33_580 [Caulobacteraceae bacterium]|nr:hypothetical protein [Caulobacteraceae bacterium]